MIETYIKKVASITKRGDAREESYYSALAELLESFSETKRHKKVQVTVLPKKTEAGNPDFRVWDGKHSQVGYVEAKPPNANLDEIETTEQLKRYISTFPNLILTNFYEFRLYRHGQCVDNVLLARPYIPAKLKTIPPAEHTTEFMALLEKFFQFSLPTKFTAESLAYELATRTRFLRDEVIKEEIREARSEGAKKILGFYEAFQTHLIANLKPDEFADLYAQTITYGLFAARTRANSVFNRKLAYDLIPKTIGILREIFSFISLSPPEQLEATVDDIAEVLAVADVKKILHQYFKEGKGSDPIFHFYETFLAEYNPEERERRGVYYTPEPVVSYIVRSLDIILKESFSRQDGFATHSVTVLDPAAGTLTFLAEAAKIAVQKFVSKYGEGSKAKYIEDHILQHFFAFELMMAPYAAGHLKMGYLLEELGHKLSGDERFQFYLTNTLEMEELAQTSLPGMASLSEESHLAGKIKKEKPILVILGNPPYSGISANVSERQVEVKKGQKYTKGYTIRTKQENGRTFYQLLPKEAKASKKMRVRLKTWIGELIEYYKVIDGDWFGERKHWLQDDYVKFIRFAQWKIDQIGEGIVGFITNHAYLDNPTFRGMRQSLMNSFDEIYILDLHGNSLKKEKAPDGSKDENVFDIQQGVAIALFVKHKTHSSRCRVFHRELWGLRDHKYYSLSSNDFKTATHTELSPSSPYYFFVPKKETHRQSYEQYPLVTDLFTISVNGIVTARDRFVIDFSDDLIRNRIMQFRNLTLDDTVIKQTFSLDDTRGWKLSKARKKLAEDPNWNTYFSDILYRPFDYRRIYYTPTMVDWGRQEVMRHLFQPNVCLVTPKRLETKIPWSHVFISEKMIDHVTVSLKTVDYCFPLYVYPDIDKHDLFSHQESGDRLPNLAPKLLTALSSTHKQPPTPEYIFNYVYAVLYSNAYRKKYAEFLKTDFPRVPFTKDSKLFQKVALKGAQLVDLHLLKSAKLAKPIAKCEGSSDLQVIKVAFDEKKKRVYINPDKYFAGVPSEVWEYHIGGYQVAEKWLKDRKGRTLSSEEIATYVNVVTAIAETIKIQESLDDLFKEVESNLLEVSL
ncbi:MAG: type ISP restriction/modification enzyme [Bacteroidota bacterium]